MSSGHNPYEPTPWANQACPPLLQDLIPVLVTLALTFNFFLSIVNANLFSLGAREVILAEIGLLGVAAAISFTARGARQNPWIFLFLIQLTLLFALFMWRTQLDVKPIRDAIIAPIFITLGIMARRFDLIRYLFWLCLVIIAVGLIEALFLPTYSDIVNALDYFISKGALSESDRISTGTNLFVSGIRPNNRFLFDLFDGHRVSSIFLEPISMGVFGSIAGMVFLAYRSIIPRSQYYVGLFLSFLIIWLADGRLSLGTLALCVVIRPLFVRLNVTAHALTAPVILLGAVFVHWLGLLPNTGEGTGARLASTMSVLSDFDVGMILGLRRANGGMMDTGLGYVVGTQGIAGFLLFWLAPVFLSNAKSTPARLMVGFVSIYLALGLMFTQSMFSIKTAAFLWVAFGYTIAENYRGRDRRETSMPRFYPPFWQPTRRILNRPEQLATHGQNSE